MDKPTCGTCPYWGEEYTRPCCCLNPGEAPPIMDADGWCGQHPDFPAWLKAESKRKAPDIRPMRVDRPFLGDDSIVFTYCGRDISVRHIASLIEAAQYTARTGTIDMLPSTLVPFLSPDEC